MQMADRLTEHARGHRRLSAAQVGQIGLRQIAELTGRQPEGVTGVEPGQDGWIVSVEVVEGSRESPRRPTSWPPTRPNSTSAGNCCRIAGSGATRAAAATAAGDHYGFRQRGTARIGGGQVYGSGLSSGHGPTLGDTWSGCSTRGW